ncbi:Uncharacterised protein [BD1-7 clade bacterium]|uniref:DUF6471 domain-containing protein n=1 Tax=BD1-7 clade bacterium TaxID=2029982 RepID=A0A5S9N1I1_9GAMM|nr:Uncharacterised protein [BD1-7 clade bacterium]CAA0083488.1 Uncharacterised protein [BD1-7 clade bacterium]
MLQNDNEQISPIPSASWREVVSRLIKSEMSKRKIKYDDLSRLLEELGTKQTAANLRNKINRGIMGADLLIQLVLVLNLQHLTPDMIREILETVDE